MRLPLKVPVAATGLIVFLGIVAHAAVSSNMMTQSETEMCITSNGLPDHETGTFPNSGNPHSIKEQTVKVCVTSTPEKGGIAQKVNVTGIAKNGVLIRPGTADYYDASSPRGHSRDSSSGWNLDGMGARETLGLDENNAHVDFRGLYHYHGMPEALVNPDEGTLMGWAADGFQIHYVGTSAKSSYMLKAGTRETAPFGAYDGTYNEDFEYVRGYGNLDECNGAVVEGTYHYFATDTYPYFPHCLFGTDITRIR